MNLEYLRNKRIEYGVNQKEMAEILQISYVAYKFIETGKRKPRFELMIKIINTLKLDANKLLNVNNQMSA